MHHSFYGVRDKAGRLITSCDKPFGKPLGGGSVIDRPVTGLDSKVTCGDCMTELGYYRNYFPQASNRTQRVVGPNGNMIEVATLEGGAR